MKLFNKFFNKTTKIESNIIVLSEVEGQKRIKTWKEILSKQDKAIDKIEQGLKVGKSWVGELPDRIKTAKTEAESIKAEMKKATTEDRLLSLGKQYISKDRLIKNLILTEKAMLGNLRVADLQYNRLQDRAIELATKIQESEVYLSMAGSLQLAKEYIQEIEQPVEDDAMESIASFKSVNAGIEKDEISDEEVKNLFRKEFNRVSRRNDTEVVRENRTTKKAKTKANNKPGRK